MLTTVEAVLQPGGTLKFLEPVHLQKPQRVLVMFTHPDDEALSGLALSEPSLSTDWLSDEEEPRGRICNPKPFALSLWFDRLTMIGLTPFALSLSKGWEKARIMIEELVA